MAPTVSISAASKASTALVDVLQTIDADSCPYRYNFHLHTCCSDGQLQPEVLIQQAIDLKLDGLAITDHHSIAGYQAAAVWLDQQATTTRLWSGVEITASLAATEVHILGYDFDLTAPKLHPYLQGHRVEGRRGDAKLVIDAIHQAGGLAVLAHPARYKKAPQELAAAAVDLNIDGLETYYCYKSSRSWQPSPAETRLMQQLSAQYQLLQTCGTDTHGVDIRQRR